MAGKTKAPLEHVRRAQELLEQVDGADGIRDGEWAYLRIQIAHLHLRAAEVGSRVRDTELKQGAVT